MKNLLIFLMLFTYFNSCAQYKKEMKKAQIERINIGDYKYPFQLIKFRKPQKLKDIESWANKNNYKIITEKTEGMVFGNTMDGYFHTYFISKTAFEEMKFGFQEEERLAALERGGKFLSNIANLLGAVAIVQTEAKVIHDIVTPSFEEAGYCYATEPYNDYYNVKLKVKKLENLDDNMVKVKMIDVQIQLASGFITYNQLREEIEYYKNLGEYHPSSNKVKIYQEVKKVIDKKETQISREELTCF